MRILFLSVFVFFTLSISAQHSIDKKAKKWADSVYNSLNENEKIGQLIIARLSSMEAQSKKVTNLNEQVEQYVKQYNIGGVCVFQGNPIEQVGYINHLKKIAKTPILFSIDGEWGVGMRLFDSVQLLPKQMMLGALSNPSIVYKYGKVVAKQCKRLGIQMNYAPVVDVNNNPQNPIINDRSFGEDKKKVAAFGIQYMKGMQQNGVLACAKHFPGHGDVTVDSHFDLPVIHKSIQELEQTELYPFEKLFRAGVSSAMIAHLFIPSIDSQINKPTSMSEKNIQGLLRNKMKFKGLAITDGLEMHAVTKFFPNGEASVQALIAGNDLLCLPDSIPVAIAKIKEAIDSNRLTWKDIEEHCKKVLMTKYLQVIHHNDSIKIGSLVNDLNKDIPELKKEIAQHAITLLSKKDKVFFPLQPSHQAHKIAYIGIGIHAENDFSKKMQKDYLADIFYLDFNNHDTTLVSQLVDSIKKNYKKVIIGVHQINRSPANNFGISPLAKKCIDSIEANTISCLFLFGNAYAAKNWTNSRNLIVCYEDDPIIQNVAIDLLKGKVKYKGVLPVSIDKKYPYGFGLHNSNKK